MSSPDNHLYEFGQFVLDARSRILLKDGATVRLTPKAFDTLLVLIQHGVQLVEKEQLLKEVWPDTFVEQGSLSRNTHELRKALGDHSGEPRYIETIPKRGYRLLTPVKVTDAAGDAKPARAAPRPAAIGNMAQRKALRRYRSSRCAFARCFDRDVCLSARSRRSDRASGAREEHAHQINQQQRPGCWT